MTLLHSNNKASRSLREVLQIKSILDPMTIIHTIPEKSALGWLLRACPENRIARFFFFFFASWIANNTFPCTPTPRCPLVETFGDVVKSPGQVFLPNRVNGSLEMTLMHDADYRPHASLPTDPDHMTPDPSTTPAALGVNDEEKDVTFRCAAETDDVERTGCTSPCCTMNDSFWELEQGFNLKVVDHCFKEVNLKKLLSASESIYSQSRLFFSISTNLQPLKKYVLYSMAIIRTYYIRHVGHPLYCCPVASWDSILSIGCTL